MKRYYSRPIKVLYIVKLTGLDYNSDERLAHCCIDCPDRRRGRVALADAAGRSQQFVSRFDDSVRGMGSPAFCRAGVAMVEGETRRGSARRVGFARGLWLCGFRAAPATTRVLVSDGPGCVVGADRNRGYFRSVSFTFALIFSDPRSTCTETSSPALWARRAYVKS